MSWGLLPITAQDAFMEALEIFHFEEGRESFETYALSNGFRHWLASQLMTFLGYDSWASFKKAINKAIGTCSQNGIPIDENFQKVTSLFDGKPGEDYKLSRFACYLTTMYCDQKKPQVQKAYAYFAAIADQFQKYIEDAESCERLAIRDEITEHEKSMSAVAKGAGVVYYQLFQNAGYRGMYNMNLSELKAYKGLPDAKRCLLDFMNREELAANLFRITQTEAKIKNEGIRGQHASERAAEKAGREVRETMRRISGTAPEDLPLADDIRETRKAIKSTHKTFQKLDVKKKAESPDDDPAPTDTPSDSDGQT